LPNPHKRFYRSRGCEECGFRGYKGRIGIFEILEVNEIIRRLIIQHVSSEEITQAAIANGMLPLLKDGINKASGGLTSLEEVVKSSTGVVCKFSI